MKGSNKMVPLLDLRASLLTILLDNDGPTFLWKDAAMRSSRGALYERLMRGGVLCSHGWWQTRMKKDGKGTRAVFLYSNFQIRVFVTDTMNDFK
jgi:hypothetical protein